MLQLKEDEYEFELGIYFLRRKIYVCIYKIYMNVYILE